MKKVIIIGEGGHGKVIADIVRSSGDQLVGFLDDSLKPGALGAVTDYEKYGDCWFIVGIGNAEIRERIVRSLSVRWYTAIHPSAVVSPSASIGEGSVVMPNAVINAESVIGNHCIVNTGAIIEHNNTVCDYAHVSVGAKLGGTVKIGRASWIGIGSVINNNLSVCDGSTVGAGAVVVQDITEPGVYVGIPAAKIH